MSTERKTPRRRFKEFQNTEVWEQRKIGEAGSFYYGHSCPKWSVTEDATIPCIRYGELYTKFGTKIDRVFSHTNMPPGKLRFSKGNEVLIPRVGEDPMDYNHCTWLSIPGVAIGEMISVYNTEQNPLFTATMFNATLQEEFAIRVEGGSVTNLYFEKLKSIEVSFPSIDEQEKIATYFEQLDNIITLHQHKLEKLKALKKAYLAQMFPAEGERKPKLRFAGFNDEWEQYKLGEICTIITKGTTPNDKSWEGTVNYIKTESIDKESGSLSNTCNTSMEEHEGFLKRSQLENNDVLFSIVGTLGRVGLVKDKDLPANTNQQIAIIRLNDTNPYFILNALKTPLVESFIASDATIGAQPSLSLWQINDMKINLPNKEEQKKIGEYFTNLDNLITLHQRKLEKLQNLKKAYLNEMFI